MAVGVAWLGAAVQLPANRIRRFTDTTIWDFELPAVQSPSQAALAVAGSYGGQGGANGTEWQSEGRTQATQ